MRGNGGASSSAPRAAPRASDGATSVGDRLRSEDEQINKAMLAVSAGAPAKSSNRARAPSTYLDALTALQAKALRDDKKKKDRRQEVDFKRLAADPQTLVQVASSAGISKQVLQIAVNTLPALSSGDEDDRRTIFWRIMDDYFRRVNQDDLDLLRSFVVDPRKDPDFKVPNMGKKYWLQWQDEERIDAERKHVPATSPVHKNKARTTQASKVQDQRKTISTVVSPREDGQDPSELCDVCCEGESTEDNMIIFCERCNVAVHQSCYGVPKVPAGPWICRKCSIKEESGKQMKCVLCPVQRGAMKPVHPNSCVTCTGKPSKEQQWVHLFCSQWIPETFIRAEDTVKMEPVQNLNGINKERFKLLCSICKQRHGACIQCSHGNCTVAFHPLCARAAGLLMEVVGYEGSDDVDLKAYCQKHSKKPVRRALIAAGDAKAKTSEDAATPQTLRSPPLRTPAGKGAETTGQQKAAPAIGGVGAKKGKSGAPIDMLSDLTDVDCVALFRQICIAFRLKLADVAAKIGLSDAKVASWVKDARTITPDEVNALKAWLRDYGKSLQEPETKPAKPNPAEGAGAGTGVAGKGAAGARPAVEGAPSKGPLDLPTIPKCFKPGLNETMHMYTNVILGQDIAGIPVEELGLPVLSVDAGVKKKGSALAASPGPAPPPSPGPGAGPPKRRTHVAIPSHTNAKGAVDNRLIEAIAISPHSETMSELFMTQEELVRQMLGNRVRIHALLERMQVAFKVEGPQFDEMEADMKVVHEFVEASKEAKRVLKRERRAVQQKENLAAAEAAVAASTRYSAGRKLDDDGASAEDDGADVELIIPDVRTKDSTGRDVIYDKFFQMKSEEVLCAVCGDGKSEKPNEIVFCEMCDLAVHQQCFGISQIPDGEWLCWPCKEYQERMLKLGKKKEEIRKPRWQGGDLTALDAVSCAICPVKRGAFKQTVDGDWVHMVCAMCHPGVTIGEDDVLKSVSSVKGLMQDCKDMTCIVCKETMGAPVKCHYGPCQNVFHPQCARAAGFVLDTKAGSRMNRLVRAYCPRHAHMLDASSPSKHSKIPPQLQQRIAWLEANFGRLRQSRQELDRLRLICDVLMRREKTKTNLLKSEKEYVLKCLGRPDVAKLFEDKMKDADFAKGILSAGQGASNGDKLKRKAGWFAQPLERQADAKRARGGGEGEGSGAVMVDRERVMTVDQAQATNNKLPEGYLYVPLQFGAKKA